MTRLHDLSLVAQVAALRDGRIRPVELTSHYLDRIARAADLGAFAEVTAESALARAAALDAGGHRGPLWGVPSAEKDLVARAGVPTRYGSRARADYVAVAAGLLPAAVGSDGGGSIRIPSATVGVVGLKPSRGRLPIGSGFDSPDGLSVTGPIARTVEDAGLLLDALVGLSPFPYATAAPGRGPFVRAARTGSATYRIGATTVSPWDDDEDIVLDPAARTAFETAAVWLSDAGHPVTDADWHPVGYPALFRVLWRASAARIPLSAHDMTLVEPLTAWLVREGRALSAPELLGGLTEARAFERRTITDFAAFDAVLTPALAQAPQPVGAYAGHDPERTFAMQVEYAPYSSFVNVAGLPALTLPVTVDATGHPVSVQLIGRPGGEATLLALGAELELRRGPLPHPPAWDA
uniref:amidase n=1 Tax=Microbacterium proteolyticum TaxID=1572644 RepID=UPI002416358A|nr:amidase [Microbacterium proteolyticum]